MDVRMPDGTIIQNVPEGTSKAELATKLKSNGMNVPAEWMSSADTGSMVSSTPTGNNSVGAQFGLTLRHGVKAAATIPAMLADGVTGVYNASADALGTALGMDRGYRFKQQMPILDKVLTDLGLPQPTTPMERIVGRGVEMGSGAGMMATAANAGARVTSDAARRVFEQMAVRPATQTVAGATGGIAGEHAKENGAGFLGQLSSSVLGGLAGAGLASGASSLKDAVMNAARAWKGGTAELDARLSFELSKSGIQWEDLGAAAKLQLREDAKKAIYSNQPLDPAALGRLADFRITGAKPMLGDITQDPALITQQRNLAKQMANMTNPGTTNLPGLQNENAKAVLNTLERSTNSPLDAYATGQGIIGRIRGTDAGAQAAERALYKTAQDQAGREIQLDRGGFLNEAFGNLAKINKMAFLPEQIGTLLNQLGKGSVRVGGRDYPVPFDVNAIDSLKTTLASASRASADGNTKAAIAAVRSALENVQPKAPSLGGSQVATPAQAAALRSGDPVAQAMEAFDAARGFARNRRVWQESAGFIEDALGGVAPDKFAQKHIIGSTVEDLAKLSHEIGGVRSAGRAIGPVVPGAQGPAGPDLREAVRGQMVDYVLQRGRADSNTTTFAGKAMQDAFKAIGDRKWALFFSPDEIQTLKSAVNVARYSQSQPIGSAVNNSSSAGAVMAGMNSLLGKTANLPVIGPQISEPLLNGMLKLQARGMGNLSKGLLAEEPVQGSFSAGLLGPSLFGLAQSGNGGLLSVP